MYVLFLLTTLISFCTCDPRTPKIYNVLISSKKNLAPSQALPVYEPVLHTTSLGLAFPPLFYTPLSAIEPVPSQYVNGGPIVTQGQSTPESEHTRTLVQNDVPKIKPDVSGGANLPKNVLPIDQYIPYYTPLTYESYYPKEEQVTPAGKLEKYLESANDPKQIVANLKKNPDIPDVPPPPLPVTTKT